MLAFLDEAIAEIEDERLADDDARPARRPGSRAGGVSRWPRGSSTRSCRGLARPARRDGGGRSRPGLSEARALVAPDARLRARLRREPADARCARRGRSTSTSRSSGAVAAHLFGWLALAPLLAYGAGGAGAPRRARLRRRAAASSARGRRSSGRCCSAAPVGARRSALVGVAVELAAPAAVAAGSSWLGYAALAFWLWLFAASLAEAEGFAATAPGGGGRGRGLAAVVGAGRRSPAGGGASGGAAMWGQLVIDSLMRPRAAARRILGARRSRRDGARRRRCW